MNVSPSDKIKEFYSGNAEMYNRMMDEEIKLPIYHTMLSELMQRINHVKGAILDSSCGSGHMLELIQRDFAPVRELKGIDLSPDMVEMSSRRLKDKAVVLPGDMTQLHPIADQSCAAVINFFAIHHVHQAGLNQCLATWNRVLASGGVLMLGAWEGEGHIDYGEHGDIEALKYSLPALEQACVEAGFTADKFWCEWIEDMGMKAVYGFAVKP